MKIKRLAEIVTHVGLLIGAGAVLFPIALIFLNSFKTSEEIRQHPISFPKSFHYQNYTDVWKIANFGRLFINSIVVLVLALALIYIVSLLAAYAFAKFNFPGKGLLYVLLLSGIMFPIQVAIIPLFEMVTKLHLVNNPLSIVLVNSTFALPFAVLILTTFIRGVSAEILEAARIDGCGPMGILFRIIRPLIVPAMTTVLIIIAIIVWNDLLLPVLFMTSASAKTLPAGMIYFSGIYTSQWEYISAAIMIMSLPIMVFFIFMQKDIINGLSAGAVKG